MANYHSYALAAIVVPSAFFILSFITVFLRICVRTCVTRSFGWDDGTILLSLLCFLVTSGLIITLGIVQMAEGYTFHAIHTIRFNSHSAIQFTYPQYTVTATSCYLLTQILLKTSITLYFLRLIKNSGRFIKPMALPLHRWTLIFSTSIYAVYNLGYLFINIFQCGNPKHLSAGSSANACLPFRRVLVPLNISAGAVNAFVDWLFVIVSISLVVNMQLPRRAKIASGILIALSFLAATIATVRIPFYEDFKPDFESTIHTAISLLSIVEIGLGMTADGSFWVMLPDEEGGKVIDAQQADDVRAGLEKIRRKSAFEGYELQRPKGAQYEFKDVDLATSPGKGNGPKMYGVDNLGRRVTLQYGYAGEKGRKASIVDMMARHFGGAAADNGVVIPMDWKAWEEENGSGHQQRITLLNAEGDAEQRQEGDEDAADVADVRHFN
ncbi:hypothetical protein H2203_002257 [Taxawa tesnikishii (nom. ined.)]|nr:hypothetical protein H2203_002257 [Dothideales sp. JES 119]